MENGGILGGLGFCSGCWMSGGWRRWLGLNGRAEESEGTAAMGVAWWRE